MYIPTYYKTITNILQTHSAIPTHTHTHTHNAMYFKAYYKREGERERERERKEEEESIIFKRKRKKRKHMKNAKYEIKTYTPTQFYKLINSSLLHKTLNLDKVELDLISSFKSFHLLIPTFLNDFSAWVVRTGGLCNNFVCLVLCE